MPKCDGIVVVMNTLSTRKTNTMATNITSTASINCHSKKVRDCYIVLTVLSIKITLLMAVSICCYLIKYRTKHCHFTSNKQVL